MKNNDGIPGWIVESPRWLLYSMLDGQQDATHETMATFAKASPGLEYYRIQFNMVQDFDLDAVGAVPSLRSLVTPASVQEQVVRYVYDKDPKCHRVAGPEAWQLLLAELSSPKMDKADLESIADNTLSVTQCSVSQSSKQSCERLRCP
jgi:hypothetical protein